MSGILGVWNLDGRPVDRGIFKTSLSLMANRGPSGSDIWISDSVALGCYFSETSARQPSVHGELACVFDGRLDNRDELIAELRDHPLFIEGCPDVQLVLAAYERYRDSFPRVLEGDFALAIVDPCERRLTLARDRVGVRPLCYGQFGSTLLFGSDAKALLAFPGVIAAPDEELLADFILYFPSVDARARTFFRGIHSLPPAHAAVLADQKLTVRPYFDFDTTGRIQLADFHEYGMAFSELFERAVRRRLRCSQPVAVSVSGGLDSSYIFCLADRLTGKEAGLSPEVFGLNYSGEPGTPSDESTFLSELREQCKAPIEHLEYQPGFIATALEDAWHSESPDIEGIGRTQRSLMNRAYERGARLILTGHWGDQFLVSWEYLLDLIYRGDWKRLRAHQKAWQIDRLLFVKTLIRDVLERIAPEPILAATRGLRSRFDGPWASPWFTRRFRDALRSRFAAARLPRMPGTSNAWYVYRQSRLGYQVHCMEWNSRIAARSGLEIAFPFLDRDIIQFLMSVPGEIQAHDGIARNIMREAMRGIVPEAIVNRRTKGVFTHLGNEGVEHDFDKIEELLGPNSLAVAMGFFDGPVLWKMLQAWRQENRSSDTSVIAWRITDLCGFEAFLRSFFGGERRQPT